MKEVNTEKVIGYLLLTVGLGIIVYSAFNVVGVFKGKNQPFDLFSFSSIALDLSNITGEPFSQNTNLKQELLESDLINKPINLIAHLLLMGFIASIGFKVAQIGTTLVRPIKVNIIGKKEEINQS